uniref:Uncharacterized protein n=1 Tax=Leptocylindrus danicus TaxID=163516 RepID=A0A6U2LPK6_9STRA
MKDCESLDDLTNLFTEKMNEKGVLQKLKGQLRAEIYHAITASPDENNEQIMSEPPPLPIRENLLINELIREYLAFNGYEHTVSVFCAEAEFGAKTGTKMFQRKSIIDEFVFPRVGNDVTCQHQLPLMYELIAAAKRNKK